MATLNISLPYLYHPQCLHLLCTQRAEASTLALLYPTVLIHVLITINHGAVPYDACVAYSVYINRHAIKCLD